MAAITDYSTDVAKVRLLISDIDDASQIFNDQAISAFLSMALDGNVKRAAAQALLVMASNEVLVQKKIRILDLSTDGPAEAEALRKLALQLREEADLEEIDGAFDWAEQINTPAQYREFLYKDGLRNGTG
jgi:hypothetical protein